MAKAAQSAAFLIFAHFYKFPRHTNFFTAQNFQRKFGE